MQPHWHIQIQGVSNLLVQSESQFLRAFVDIVVDVNVDVDVDVDVDDDVNDDVDDDDVNDVEGEGQSATNQDNHQESQSCAALSS